MIVNKGEFIDSFMLYMRHQLEHFLPEEGFEYKMLEESYRIIRKDIKHIQKTLTIMRRDDEQGNG